MVMLLLLLPKRNKGGSALAPSQTDGQFVRRLAICAAHTCRSPAPQQCLHSRRLILENSQMQRSMSVIVDKVGQCAKPRQQLQYTRAARGCCAVDRHPAVGVASLEKTGHADCPASHRRRQTVALAAVRSCCC
jgi:hypothetical protein